MVSRFNIKGLDLSSFRYYVEDLYYDFVDLMGTGEYVLENFSKKIQPQLSKYLRSNGHLDASLLQGDWFPTVKSDIFISHSRKDKDLAIALSGFLYDNFGLTAFVDSTIWGNIEELQKKVDRPLYNTKTKTYSYNKRNQSTAYVHMLLSTALTKMIDNSEAIFFLSTPNSLNSNGTLTTSSAWIYHEIFTANCLRLKYPVRARRLRNIMFSEGILEGKIADGYSMDFKVDLTKFHVIDYRIMDEWVERKSGNLEANSLDLLYGIYQPTRPNRLLG